MVSPFLSPFGAVAQGAAGGYQSALSQAEKARQFAAEQALKRAIAQSTAEYHAGMVQNGADRAASYGQSVDNNGIYQQGRLASANAKNVGLGIVPGEALPPSGTSFENYRVPPAPGAPPPPSAMAGVGPATLAKIAKMNADAGLVGARTDYVAGPQTQHTQAQSGYITGPQTAHTQAGTGLLTAQAAQLPLDARQKRALEQAQAAQALMNTQTMPGLRKAQASALGTNAGANAYRAQIFGQDDPVRAQAAAAQAAAAGQNAGTNAGRLGLAKDTYNFGSYGQRNPAAGTGKLPNGMSYTQAAAAKQKNLAAITLSTSRLYAKNADGSWVIADPHTRNALILQINSLADQNGELDRALPAGNGLAPAPVTSRVAPPPHVPHHSATQPRSKVGHFSGPPKAVGLSGVSTQELLRRLARKVK